MKAKTPPRDHGRALFLSQMPPEVIDAAKAQAQSEGRSLKWVITKLLEMYAERGEDLWKV